MSQDKENYNTPNRGIVPYNPRSKNKGGNPGDNRYATHRAPQCIPAGAHGGYYMPPFVLMNDGNGLGIVPPPPDPEPAHSRGTHADPIELTAPNANPVAAAPKPAARTKRAAKKAPPKDEPASKKLKNGRIQLELDNVQFKMKCEMKCTLENVKCEGKLKLPEDLVEDVCSTVAFNIMRDLIQKWDFDGRAERRYGPSSPSSP